MANEAESKNNLWRREEQLKRWNSSETNKASSNPRNKLLSKVKFQDGCVFLAACSSGDTDEVSKLLNNQADINTTNVDGLTALHQACIDDNLDMVKFLVDHGANVNACDNEGWTSLHATASCGFIQVARFLIDRGAALDIVNNDGDLPVDLSEGKEMEDLLTHYMDKQGIDAENARNEEEEMMLRDANQWLNNGSYDEEPHPKTGATALHIAAAKGYIKVMKILLQVQVNIEAKDYDGWTPIHAAAHWGQEEACKILAEHFCDLDAKNLAGQTPQDVADPELESLLDELKKHQDLLLTRERGGMNINGDTLRGSSPAKRRSSITRMSIDQKQNILTKNAEEERAQLEAVRKGTIDEMKVDEPSSDEEEQEMEVAGSSGNESDSESNATESDKQNKLNDMNDRLSNRSVLLSRDKPTNDEGSVDNWRHGIVADPRNPSEKVVAPPVIPALVTPRIKDMEVRASQSPADTKTPDVAKRGIKDTEVRAPQSPADTRTPDVAKRVGWRRDSHESTEIKQTSGGMPVKSDVVTSSVTTSPVISSTITSPSTTTVTSPAKMFTARPLSSGPSVFRHVEPVRVEDDPSQWRAGLRKTNSTSTVPEGPTKGLFDRLYRSSSGSWGTREQYSDIKQGESSQRGNSNDNTSAISTSLKPNDVTSVTTTTVALTSVISVPLITVSSSSSSSSIATTTTLPAALSVTGSRRSFEVPKRDEEKEVERKARAKRARETRRSTQGVTKEDLVKAEEALQVVGVTSRSNTDLSTKPLPATDKPSDLNNKKDTTTTTTDATVTLRKPSDADKKTTSKEAVTTERQSTVTEASTHADVVTVSPSPVAICSPMASSVSGSSSYSATPYRGRLIQAESELKTKDDSSSDKDDSEETALARWRRERKKRRAPAKIVFADAQAGEKNAESTDQQKTVDESKPADRTSLTKTTASSAAETPLRYQSSILPSTSGISTGSRYATIDNNNYKKLYEDEQAANTALRKELKQLQRQLAECKADLDKSRNTQQPVVPARSSETSADRRERRALERKLSELEEELKEMQELKAANQKLKEENGALIRVISKLSK